jgi:hypothetical protein
MKMKWLSILIILMAFQATAATAAPSSSIDRKIQSEISRLKLQSYQAIGHQILQDLSDELTADDKITERLDSRYSTFLRLEKLSAKANIQSAVHLPSLIKDVNSAVALKESYNRSFRNHPTVRLKIQSVFVGLMTVVEALARINLGQSLDQLLTLDRYLVSKATFFTTEANEELRIYDVVFDYLWLRNLKFPVEIVDLSLKKVRAIYLATTTIEDKSALQAYMGYLAFASLQRGQSVTTVSAGQSASYTRLFQVAMESFAENKQIYKELQWMQYKFLQKMGRGAEAYEIRNSLYLDQLSIKVEALYKEPISILKKNQNGMISKFTSILTSMVRNLFLVFKYSVGFVLIATPFELAVLLVALVILAQQGYRFFGESQKSLKELIAEHRVLQSDGWKRWPMAIRALISYMGWHLNLAWRMFTTTYTGASVPFYSKVASSLLLFAVGLYFNSAKNLAETLLTQTPF